MEALGRWLVSTFLMIFIALIYLALVVWNGVKLIFQFPLWWFI